jgi:hypothetical protein
MNSLFLGLVTIVIAFSSCQIGPTTPNGDYYNIKKADIFIVKKYDEDSLNIDINNDTGYCKKLEIINSLNTSSSIGIMLRMEADRNNNANYGPYEKGGLIEKIKTISIFIENDGQKKEITSELYGDSAIIKYQWRDEDYADNPNSNHVSSIDCNQTFYYPTISSLIKMGNGYKIESESITDTDYFFWIRKSFLKSLHFTPKILTLKVETIDGTSGHIKKITDTLFMKL